MRRIESKTGKAYPVIRYKNVSICQQEMPVLEHINLELHAGEFVYITGKVGAGKTTLLKTFYGEAAIQSGEAEVIGYNLRRLKPRYVPMLRRQLGIVFQDFQLLTDRTVHDNLAFVLRATGWKHKDEREDRIWEVLKLVGMERKGYKHPAFLSGGEQQRVVIARALLNSPRVILADEPTGNLDVETGKDITALLHGLAADGTLVVMATHNLHLLQEYPGKVYRCTDGHSVEEAEIEPENLV